MATLQEIETHWSLDDLLDANDALDLKEQAEAQRMKEIQERSKPKGRR